MNGLKEQKGAADHHPKSLNTDNDAITGDPPVIDVQLQDSMMERDIADVCRFSDKPPEQCLSSPGLPSSKSLTDAT